MRLVAAPPHSSTMRTADQAKRDFGEQISLDATQRPCGAFWLTLSDQQQGKSPKSAAASASSIPGFTAADDAETLKKQIEDLANRLNQVDHRLDSREKPENETPPAVHTLQTKVGNLTAELDQVARLPCQFRSLEKRLSSIEQRIKTLRDEADTRRRKRSVVGCTRRPTCSTSCPSTSSRRPRR